MIHIKDEPVSSLKVAELPIVSGDVADAEEDVASVASVGAVGQKRSIAPKQQGSEAGDDNSDTTTLEKSARLQSLGPLVRRHQGLLENIHLLQFAEFVNQEMTRLKKAEDERAKYSTRSLRNSSVAGKRPRSPSGGSDESYAEGADRTDESAAKKSGLLSLPPSAQYSHFAALYREHSLRGGPASEHVSASANESARASSGSGGGESPRETVPRGDA